MDDPTIFVVAAFGVYCRLGVLDLGVRLVLLPVRHLRFVFALVYLLSDLTSVFYDRSEFSFSCPNEASFGVDYADALLYLLHGLEVYWFLPTC